MFGLTLWVLMKSEDPLVVELYAQQFNWKARYGGADNT